MKRTISGMLGLLPSDQFHVVIEALWLPLSKLLVSSMMTGYTLRNAEYRLCLERNLNIYEGNTEKQRPEISKSDELEILLDSADVNKSGKHELSSKSEENTENPSEGLGIQGLGEMTAEAQQYILHLQTQLSSVKKELCEVKRKNAALQMQQFVGEEQNDLLDYLRSLQPEKVCGDFIDQKLYRRVWLGGGRGYKLELCCNRAGGSCRAWREEIHSDIPRGVEGDGKEFKKLMDSSCPKGEAGGSNGQVLDSERVLRLGLRRYGGKILYPERWYPEIWCFKSGACAKEVWVRIVGDVCRGFVAVDKDIALRRNMQWARILIRFNVRGLPTSLHEVVRKLVRVGGQGEGVGPSRAVESIGMAGKCCVKGGKHLLPLRLMPNAKGMAGPAFQRLNRQACGPSSLHWSTGTRCMLLGHYLRGLEYRVELIELLSLSSDAENEASGDEQVA
uniref:DUF4283 domain-containing protein n=1 Tax=Vitis vinifera TaxID=29760 RepID=A5B2M0_VITVI|nr:hypothetical protein VITISV_008017 [Vitis vinifera]